MKNIYIDSNIWLSLYSFTNDDLQQFKKLKALEGKEIKIYIPSQTRDEVLRNRENKIKKALEKFANFKIEFPVFCKGYEEYNAFYDKYKELKSEHKKWNEKIQNDIKNQVLPADKVIKDLFITCETFECSKESIINAELRYKAGNPPGKDNKYGDAINWECLLICVPEHEDLYLVSDDKDYKSIFDDAMFNPFLRNEWKTKKFSDIHFYNKITSFLNDNFDGIYLKEEERKEEFLDSLKRSENAQTTCALIRSITDFNCWSDRQIDDICMSVLSNPEREEILVNNDIREIFKKLIDHRSNRSSECFDILCLIDPDHYTWF